jgi:hypothetical protein
VSVVKPQSYAENTLVDFSQRWVSPNWTGAKTTQSLSGAILKCIVWDFVIRNASSATRTFRLGPRDFALLVGSLKSAGAIADLRSAVFRIASLR